ncbi:hypothetical protein PSPO01_06627 [Paraphaeosphaeria sporulosa]
MRPLPHLVIALLASGISAIPTFSQDPVMNVTSHGGHERACDRRCAATAEGLDLACAPGVPGRNGVSTIYSFPISRAGRRLD